MTTTRKITTDCVVLIDQGDYLQLRGGFDWGRAEHASAATVFDNQDQAEAAVARLNVGRWVRGYEPAPNS